MTLIAGQVLQCWGKKPKWYVYTNPKNIWYGDWGQDNRMKMQQCREILEDKFGSYFYQVHTSEVSLWRRIWCRLLMIFWTPVTLSDCPAFKEHFSDVWGTSHLVNPASPGYKCWVEARNSCSQPSLSLGFRYVTRASPYKRETLHGINSFW